MQILSKPMVYLPMAYLVLHVPESPAFVKAVSYFFGSVFLQGMFTETKLNMSLKLENRALDVCIGILKKGRYV